MKKFATVLVFVATVFFLAQSAYSLKCWTCTSTDGDDKGCDIPFNSEGKTLTDCPNGLNLCYRVTGTLAGQKKTQRGCGVDGVCGVSTEQGLDCKDCKSDGCNGKDMDEGGSDAKASAPKPAATLLIVFAAIAVIRAISA